MTCVKCNLITEIISAEGLCLSCLLDSLAQSSAASPENSPESLMTLHHEVDHTLEELGILTLEFKPL